jgi:MerR family mercuric resistance operon transcriptional regulator
MKVQVADSSFTVGKLARSAKVGIPTLRFYERRGLLPKPRRSASNYRLYPDETVNRVRFIRRAQELGFTLAEIKALLNLRISGRISCAEVRERAEAKITDIEERILSLRRMGRALTKLASKCNPSRPEKICPILEYLEGHL